MKHYDKIFNQFHFFHKNKGRIWSAVRAFCEKQGLSMGNVEMEFDEDEGLFFIHVDENGVKTFIITIENGDINIRSV